jgi:ABC-2 type transport system permease protein
LVNSFSDDKDPKLVFISGSESISEVLKSSFADSDDLRIEYEIGSATKLEERINELKPQLIDGSLTGIVFIPESALNDKKVRYYSTNPKNNSLFSRINPTLNSALTNLYFSGKNLTQEDIDYARNRIDIAGFRVSKDDKIEEEGYGNLIALFLFTFLLYMSLLFTGQMTMNAVVEEKNNRIVEVLLSSASSDDLMAGKILGTAITGLVQMAIWLLPVMLLVSTSWFALPSSLTLNLDMLYILYFLLNYLVALITFVGLFAAVGAIFDNPQDAQSGVWPPMLLIIIPFFIALSLQANPQNPIGRIASYTPFASLIVMPARLTMLEIPFWQLALSWVVNITVMLSVFKLAGKIYRVGILITGKKPKWSEVIKWVKYKY